MRNRGLKGLAIVAPIVVALGTATSARAADDASVIDTHHRDASSPQHFAFEVRAGMYYPRVDDDPSLQGQPYNTAFGDVPRLEIGAELDFQAVRIPFLGTLGPGVGMGYVSATRKALRADNGQESGEDTSLYIYPFYAVAVLRADVLMREAHVPLVPYVKGGVSMALWRASNSLGTSVSSSGVEGKGQTWGTRFVAGLALQLNVFDPHAARELDNSTGVNNTYLFAEYVMSDLTGLGQQGHVLYVGSHSPTFGLAFEF